jgi:hypothetical protein
MINIFIYNLKLFFKNYLSVKIFIIINMPPRKAKVVEPVQSVKVVDHVDSDSDDSTPPPSKSFNTVVKYNANDNDRIQLAQAINNLTVKGDSFVEALGSFSKFKETIVELDIQIDSKKREYKELLDRKTKEYQEKSLECQREYDEKKKQLNMTNQELTRTLQNELKNNQIETEQKLRQFKLKACDDVVKEFNMRTIKLDEHRDLLESIARVTKELDDLKKKFDTNCNANKAEEKAKFEAELKRQNIAQEQTYKTATAEMKAQFNQQNKEIEMLNRTIETLKQEITEQRNLTKEIAQASAKSQITQTFAKN